MSAHQLERIRFTHRRPSDSYFQALSRGEVPPVKDRLEQPLPSMNERVGGLSKGTLAMLHKQVPEKDPLFRKHTILSVKLRSPTTTLCIYLTLLCVICTTSWDQVRRLHRLN